MGAVAIAALNRLVGNEPGVAAAAHTAGGPAPAGDVRLILVGHAKRQPLESGFAQRREMEDELVAVVQEPIAVDRLVMTDGQVAREPRRDARCRPLDRN